MTDLTNTPTARATQGEARRSPSRSPEAHQPADGGKAQGPDFQALLREALTQPGRMAECYRMFHRYSFPNALWVAAQLIERGEPLAPIASFHHWQELGRQVRKGSRALAMAMPVILKSKRKADAEDKEETGEAQPQGRRIFVVRRNWFALHHTDGETAPLEAQAPAGWDPVLALASLGLERVDFEHFDGNCQGYALPQARQVAVSPLAAQPLKTLCHEMAHCLLHGEAERIVDGVELDRSLAEVEAESVAYLVGAALGFGDLEASRGYIQAWMGDATAEQITDRHARRILATADRILKAGRPAEPSRM